MKKKKVAFLVVGLGVGGIENYLLRFLTFYKNEIAGTVYCKSGVIGPLGNEYQKLGVRIIPFKIGYFNINDFLALKKELKKEQYVSICDFSGNFAAVPLFMAKLAGIHKRITFYRNSDEKFKKTKGRLLYNSLLNKLVKKTATKLLSNSKAAFDHFFGGKWRNNEKYEVIYNGIDAALFLQNQEDLRLELRIPADAFVIGHVGRLNEQKNHDTAIKVAIDLCSNNLDIYFIFCGENVDVRYNSVIMEAGLSDKIKLIGVRRDINRVLKTMNCFYFPSVIEGQPNALIEAMISGLPFVSSTIAPIKETVAEEYHKYLIDPMDVEKAKKKLLEIKNGVDLLDTARCAEWAISYYKPDRLFAKFFDEL